VTLDFEEPREVEASHLVWARCTVCRASDALCTPERARVARCGACLEVPGRGGEVGVYAPVVGYPMGTYVQPQPVPNYFPPPMISSHDGVVPDFAWPAPVLKLQALAEGCGWEVRRGYACGNATHSSTGRPLQMTHSIGLRFGRHAMTRNRACAVYSSPTSAFAWKWSSVWTWGPELPLSALSFTALKKWLVNSSCG
jgi:hypothetical protein